MEMLCGDTVWRLSEEMQCGDSGWRCSVETQCGDSAQAQCADTVWRTDFDRVQIGGNDGLWVLAGSKARRRQAGLVETLIGHKGPGAGQTLPARPPGARDRVQPARPPRPAPVVGH